MCVCALACARVCMYVCMYVASQIVLPMSAISSIKIIHVFVYTCIKISMRVCVCVCVCVCTVERNFWAVLLATLHISLCWGYPTLY